jgi:ABC-type sugar transport system substrate-binding protein
VKKIKRLNKKIKSLRKNLRSRMAAAAASASASLAGGKRRKSRSRRTRRRQRGGYAQYQNNQPFYNSYSVGGVLSANESALANPAPIYKISNEAIDNLNAYTMKGFQSTGH